jgi:hypothetical protein
MTRPGKVLRSIQSADRMLCVDLFMRADGSFGFEAYRRDGEGGGWFPIGGFAAEAFATQAEALTQARRSVNWLDDVLAD